MTEEQIDEMRFEWRIQGVKAKIDALSIEDAEAAVQAQIHYSACYVANNSGRGFGRAAYAGLSPEFIARCEEQERQEEERISKMVSEHARVNAYYRQCLAERKAREGNP